VSIRYPERLAEAGLELIRTAWRDSSSSRVYGYRKLHDDLMQMGESCCPSRVSRLARLAGIRTQIGYKRRPGHSGVKPSQAIDNTLDCQFDAEAPDKDWVTDITYIRTHERFSYLAVMLALFSRRVVGWSMQARQMTNLVLQALLAVVWRRKPKSRVLVHSDQGSQFTSLHWASFLKHHDLQPSMSRRGSLPRSARARASGPTRVVAAMQSRQRCDPVLISTANFEGRASLSRLEASLI